MAILNYVVLGALFCLLPAGVLWLCRRFPLLDKLGPIMILYGLGILIGNIGWHPAEMPVAQEIATSASIPLAIPMMLFACRFTLSEASLQLRVCISGFLAVFLSVVIGYLLFGRYIPEGAEIGGIMSGMYTGGMLNAAALQQIFRVEEQAYVIMCSYDIVVSFLYLVFLVSVGFKFFRWLYGERKTTKLSEEDRAELEHQIAEQKRNPYEGLWSKEGMRELAKIVGVTLVLVALSALATLPFPSEWFMVIFILVLSTLGVVCSFFKPIRALNRSFDIGMYLIYIFSVAMASMADFSKLNIADGANQIAFLCIAVFGSLVLHALLCRLMRVDADSMVASSVAFVNSPPFVPMMVVAMKNKSVLIVGLGAGIVGYALGNHFGVIMATLLGMLG
ncbi:MAG: DUF819 family protein [Rikenellaceae bacterium]|nr:DUF819 family protein [Rikenellaceae bacterium]